MNSAARKIAIAMIGLACLAPAGAQAASPAFKLSLSAQPTVFAPGTTAVGVFGSVPHYRVFAANVGAAPAGCTKAQWEKEAKQLEAEEKDPSGAACPEDSPASNPITLSDALPAGVVPLEEDNIGPGLDNNSSVVASDCHAVGQTASCTAEGIVPPGGYLEMQVPVRVDSGLTEGALVSSQATVSGGGALQHQRTLETEISSGPPAFGLAPGANGLDGVLNDVDGFPFDQAGGHPYRLSVDLGFSSTYLDGLIGTDGGPHQLDTALPPGLVVNPQATPTLCTEAQFEGFGGCPDNSAIGTITVTTFGVGVFSALSPVYNMVPPRGTAANFAFNAAGIDIFIHLKGGVRPGDYVLQATANDILARYGNPLLFTDFQLWGDPSDPSHDEMRGKCGFSAARCPVPPADVPLLTMPTSCEGTMALGARISSWLHPETFLERSGDLTDLDGNPIGVSGCNALDFAPTLKARPTTNVADSPSGLEVALQIPQTNSLGELATAHLRKAVVTLPEGITLNPASANGLAGCSADQIGLSSAIGAKPVRFNGEHDRCPAASRIGTAEVTTALLDHPLPGSVYVAAPADNPFASLLAIYLVLDDPQSGVVVKLAGHVIPDPATGRLTTVFDDNPQLPFDEFKLDFFGGASAALRTPSLCGDYSTTSQLTPYSAPESGPPATPHDDYTISQSPGGTCATSPDRQPNSPTFDAGSASPIAAAHSAFVLHLRRNDASQNFSALTVSPPPGLVAKLAGTATCPQAALDAATAKSGAAEKANPSCPAGSQVGSFLAGAGAGPAPYYASGKVYLAPPYKGAPLSFAFITPAVAGPYDLGTVLTRAAIYLDPETAKITTVSDPLPAILEGIPLDVRSLDVALDRPLFTLNGTSCDPLAVEGRLTTTLGQVTPLLSRFQLGECGRLSFAPKLSLRLAGPHRRTAHPRLIADLTAKPGEANIARAQVKLPKAAFLDNAHIKTICTRVQFAADTCPSGSIYGKASATSPLLDYPVSGPVYLRSSSHELPDLVVKLKGPDSQPLEVDLVGQTDSVKGALRNTFEAVPDVPVSTFHLELFGGKRGLIELSSGLCANPHALIQMDAHNGLFHDTSPEVRTSCPKHKKGKAGHDHRRGSR